MAANVHCIFWNGSTTCQSGILIGLRERLLLKHLISSLCKVIKGRLTHALQPLLICQASTIRHVYACTISRIYVTWACRCNLGSLGSWRSCCISCFNPHAPPIPIESPGRPPGTLSCIISRLYSFLLKLALRYQAFFLWTDFMFVSSIAQLHTSSRI